MHAFPSSAWQCPDGMTLVPCRYLWRTSGVGGILGLPQDLEPSRCHMMERAWASSMRGCTRNQRQPATLHLLHRQAALGHQHHVSRSWSEQPCQRSQSVASAHQSRLCSVLRFHSVLHHCRRPNRSSAISAESVAARYPCADRLQRTSCGTSVMRAAMSITTIPSW